MANLVWHPVIAFGHLLQHKKTEVYGGTNKFSFSTYSDISKNYMFYGEDFQLTFSCHFNLADFPFDSHECPMEFGDKIHGTSKIMFNSSQIIYGNISHRIGDVPIILNDLPFPFEFHLQSLAAFEKINPAYKKTRSYT